MSIREQIKNDILSNFNKAKEQTEILKSAPDLTAELAIECVHKYVCMKFFLDEDEDKEMPLYDLAEKSIDKALEMKLPMAKESELATTCGAAGSSPMKVALLLNALRKDVGVDINPHKLGMVRNTKELGQLFYEALTKNRKASN